jgi:hypothetical protein
MHITAVSATALAVGHSERRCCQSRTNRKLYGLRNERLALRKLQWSSRTQPRFLVERQQAAEALADLKPERGRASIDDTAQRGRMDRSRSG